MENQHKYIKGYRDLDKDTIDLINAVKRQASEVGSLIEHINKLQNEFGVSIDPRWISIAKTDLQKGFMALIRSIAQPESF